MALGRAAAVVALAITLAGCVDPQVSPTLLPTDEPTDESGATSRAPAPTGDTEETTAPVRTTSKTTTTTTAPAPAVDPLTDFEESLAGTWRRYHVKNSGEWNEYEYYEYLSFNENRTACRWKFGQESSSDSTDDVFSESDYTDWRITEEFAGAGTSFRVVVEGAGLDYVFDFTEDRVYPSGFDTLIFVRNTDGKSCFYRGGHSY